MAGDRNRVALERLYREHKDHVFNYVARLANDRELARDVTQQAFLKALNDPAVAGLESPKAYLFTVARNTLYDEWKRKKERLLAEGEEERVREMPDDPMDTPHERAASEELRGQVESAIGLMRPTYRELMLLRYGEDLSIEEIAKVTGRGVSDVKVNLHRARLAFDKDFTALMYARVARTRGKCEEIGRLLAPYEDREMPAEQIKVVDEHLSACKLCAEDAGEMKKRRELFVALPLIPAPLALDQAIQHAIAPAAHTTGSGTAAGSAARTAAEGTVTKIAAAVGVAAVLAGGGYWAMKNRAAVTPTEPPRTATADHTAPAVPTPPTSGSAPTTAKSTATVGHVRLQARAAPGDPALGDDVFWSIYTVDPKTGQRVNVTAGSGATPTFNVPAGRYLVEASQGQGSVRAEREIVVEAGKSTETVEIVLGSGQLKLGARLAAQSPLLTAGVFWSLYTKDPKTGQRKNITATGSSMPTLKVPAGRYIVDAGMNQGAVRAQQEVTVEAGKTIERNDFVLNAGTLELRTQALANSVGPIGWSVYAIKNGKRDSALAYAGPGRTEARTLLHAGRYIAIVYRGAHTVEREVTVGAGQTTRLELPLP
jgi:RNA polymerase sigma-70 factor (ECF subfamily)